MATYDLQFIWNPVTGYWEPASNEAKKQFGINNKVLTEQVKSLPEAEVFFQGKNVYLRIPSNIVSNLGEYTQNANPDAVSQEIPLLLNQPDVMTYADTLKGAANRVGKILAAYTDFTQRVGTGPLVQPGTSLIETTGVRQGKPGLAEIVTNWIKENKTKPVGDQDTLPRVETVTPSETTGVTPTTPPTPMQDLLGGGRPTEPVGRGVPLKEVTSPLTVPYGSLTPSEEDSESGLFETNGQLSLLLPDATGRSSSLVSLNQFKVDLLNLPSDKVIEYQKAFGLKQTGRMDNALQVKILDRAKTASLENYNRANPLVQDNTQISWEDAIINPQFGGGAAGDGVSVTAKQLKAAKDAIEISATELGVMLDEKALNSLASAYARGDVNATVLPYEIVRQGTIDYTKGQAAETVANLRKTASAYGVEYNEDWYKTSVANILSGKAAQDTYDAQIKEIAKSRYPSLAEQIDAGYTVQSIASPYINSMSQILELNPETISVNDPMIQRSLVYIGPDGKPSQKPIWQMEQDLRKDERWRYTKNAERELMGTGIKLLRDFGLVS